MGKKRRLPVVEVGEGPSSSRQRGEELQAAHTSDAGSQPTGKARDHPLTIVQVGQGSSRSRDIMQEELRAAYDAEHARWEEGDDYDDDETQPPSADDLVQQTAPSNDGRAEDSVRESPISNNINKKRGITLMQRIWALPPNKKLVCGLNGSKQPVGESGQTFKRWLGTLCICRNYCPLMPATWTHVDRKCKEDAWVEIEKKWIIDPEIISPANQMNWAMHLLGELRRNRRSKLKKKCYPKDALKEDVYTRKPEWADEQDYRALVDYWFDSKTKDLVDTNKRSRSFQTDIARTGPISFAQTADNMAKENGQAVERADVFIKAYCTKDGTPISNVVRDKIDKMKDILNNGGKLVGDHRDGILWAKDDAFAQVMGKERSGRVRGVGFGPTPSGRSGSNLPCVPAPSSTETVQRMIALENSMRDQLADSEQRHQQQLAEALAEAKRESDARHEQQLAEALAEAKRESDARHEQQLAEAMRESERRHQQQLDETKREMADAKRRMDEMVAFLQKNVISSISGYSGNSATS
ncbi:uncharacterized protein LOC126716790 [Quercus robur]|uniref:uncharacterized protein LOC126716790 n=1 Tax=Quercus robur TaxID=38942 RepID=UPI00216377ED|nr:uncharacterized protein LOC126716790 [Quercus robur]